MRDADDRRSRRRGLRHRRPSASMIVALVALVIALEGSAIADGSARVARLISGSRIKSSSITSKQIKDRTIKRNDLDASVLRGVYTTAQSDLRFVRNVPGTVGRAPDAAALGGKDAASFYDKGESDGRFVTKAPGSGNAAPDSAALGGHPSSEFALKGADFVGTIHGDAGAVPTHSCTTAPIGIPGGQPGEVPVMTFVGDIPAPAGLTFQLLKVSSPDQGTIRFCNPTNAASPAFADVGVRIITIR